MLQRILVPVDLTLEEAEGIGADLIVMSSHQPTMRNYLLGSNAAYVVRHAAAPCWR